MPTKTKEAEGEPEEITIAILEDNINLLTGMKIELKKPDIWICSASDQPEKFLNDVDRCQPKVAIIDQRIWEDFDAGYNAIRKIKEISPNTHCIIYTFYDQLEYFHQGVKLGIKAFVSKNTNEIALEKVIRIVANGGTYYGGLLEQYLERLKEIPSLTFLSEPPALYNPLSDREVEVLRLFGEGKSEDEIRKELFVSVNTIKAHTKNIRGKLRVNSTKEAVQVAMLRNWL